MTRLQVLIVALAVMLVLWLGFVVPTKPSGQVRAEKARALQGKGFDVEALVASLKPNLRASLRDTLSGLENDILRSGADKTRQGDLYKQLSSEWNRAGSYLVGGYYAQKVAELNPTDEHWAIAGATFYTAFRQSEDEKAREYAVQQAIRSFEKAQELNPANDTHTLNLAMCYVDGTAEPMQGITLLRGLIQKNPNNISALFALAKLSLRSGQTDKAVERIEKILSLEPKNFNAHILLGETYLKMGDKALAKKSYEQALPLTNDKQLVNELKQIISNL